MDQPDPNPNSPPVRKVLDAFGDAVPLATAAIAEIFDGTRDAFARLGTTERQEAEAINAQMAEVVEDALAGKHSIASATRNLATLRLMLEAVAAKSKHKAAAADARKQAKRQTDLLGTLAATARAVFLGLIA